MSKAVASVYGSGDFQIQPFNIVQSARGSGLAMTLNNATSYYTSEVIER